MKKKIIKKCLKALWFLLKAVGFAYIILFIVFFFDTVVEPNLARRYDKMERPDLTGTPYGPKEPVNN